MYIKDGIAYAEDSSSAIRVVGVRPLDKYKLWVKFSTGETKLFDFKPLLNAPAFTALKRDNLFNSAYIEHGCVVWDNGNIDISTDHLYTHSIPEKEAAALWSSIPEEEPDQWDLEMIAAANNDPDCKEIATDEEVKKVLGND